MPFSFGCRGCRGFVQKEPEIDRLLNVVDLARTFFSFGCRGCRVRRGRSKRNRKTIVCAFPPPGTNDGARPAFCRSTVCFVVKICAGDRRGSGGSARLRGGRPAGRASGRTFRHSAQHARPGEKNFLSLVRLQLCVGRRGNRAHERTGGVPSRPKRRVARRRGVGWGWGGARARATARGDRAGARAPIPDAETPTRRPALARARRGRARGRRLGRLRPNESRARRSKNPRVPEYDYRLSSPSGGDAPDRPRRRRRRASSAPRGADPPARSSAPAAPFGGPWRAADVRAFGPRASKVWRCGRRSSTFSDPVRTPGVANRESRAAPLIAVDRGRSSKGGKTSSQKISV